MKHFQFVGGITMWAENEEEARAEIEAALRIVNKSGDGPTVWIEDNPAEIIDEDES
jgi:hypothetical protein